MHPPIICMPIVVIHPLCGLSQATRSLTISPVWKIDTTAVIQVYYLYMCRAYITTSDHNLLPQMVGAIQDWLSNDGTFLYTYHGRIRLRAIPKCPLEITSFSDPECIRKAKRSY